jgi:predicted dehydrogenase
MEARMAYRVGLIGIGGFAEIHCRGIEKSAEEGRFKFAAACEKYPDKFKPVIDRLKSKGIRIYRDYQEMFEKEDLDIIYIATPLGVHREMTIAACKTGAYIFLEKPGAVTIQDISAMIEAERQSGKKVTVGYSNYKYSRLKKAMIDGKFGKVRCIMHAHCTHRRSWYYQRNPWVGRIMLDGAICLDSPTNNCGSHTLTNLTYLASLTPDKFGVPKRVRAELYKIRDDTENEDMSIIEAEMEDDIMLYWYCSHSGGEIWRFEIIGDRARFPGKSPDTITLRDGTEEKLEPPDGNEARIRGGFLDYVQGKTEKPFFTLEDEKGKVLAVNLSYESSRKIYTVPYEYLTVGVYKSVEQDLMFSPRNITNNFNKAINGKKLFSDIGLPWAVRTNFVSAEGYSYFDASKYIDTDFL